MSDLRALAAKATPGPWSIVGSNIWADNANEGPDPAQIVASALGRPHEDNAAYIAACDPQTILALLDRAERAEAALGSLRSGLIEVIRLSPDAPGAAYAKQVLASLESVK